MNADTCINPSDDPCWVAKTPMPTARRDLGVAADASGKIYAVGGHDGSQFLDTVEVYNPTTDSWITKSPIPYPRNDMGFTFNPVNGKFYLGGGYNNGALNDFYEYDPVADTWTPKAFMLTASVGLRFAAGQNGRIYSIGGGFLDGTYVNNVEEYDPNTNKWTIRSAIPSPRSDAGLVTASNGKMYLIGGGGIKNNTIGFLEDVDEYDPSTDSWNTKSPMSIKRHGVGASLNTEGKIYVIGGSNIDGYTQLVEEYDISTNSWNVKTLFPVAIFAPGQALGEDGKVYVMGGQTMNDPAINSNYAGFIPDLNVPLLKQTSDPWQSQIYDSADRWSPSNPTIRDWGCAMTSAAMVLKYYGINKLPNNTDLNPGTLNTWLNNQPDGYVGDGLTNWIAISRLSKLAKSNNPDFKYDALEFSRIWGENKTQLTDDIKNLRPDILEVPGHFIVGKGINGNTFNINDPYYDRSTLNDGYSNTFSSLGRYIPSNSDLSYIMLVTDPNVQITVKDSSNNPLGDQFIQQPLANDSDNTKTNGPPIKIFYFQKPDDGNYQIFLTSNNRKLYELKIYLYYRDGNVNLQNQKGVIDPSNQNTFNLIFDKQDSNNSSLKKVVTFQSMINDINQLRKLNLIQHDGISKSLISIIKSAEKDYKKGKNKIALLKLNAFELSLNTLRGKGIKEEAYQILLYDVKYLKNNF